MKTTLTTLVILSALLVSSAVYARGGYYGGGYYHSRPYAWGGYHHPRPYYYNNYHRHSHYDSGDVVAGVAVGLLTGAIIASAFTPPPPPPVYTTTRYTYVQTPVVVQQPRICVEERVVSGEWQQDPNSGGSYWVTFPYPMKRSYQVPCY